MRSECYLPPKRAPSVGSNSTESKGPSNTNRNKRAVSLLSTNEPAMGIALPVELNWAKLGYVKRSSPSTVSKIYDVSYRVTLVVVCRMELLAIRRTVSWSCEPFFFSGQIFVANFCFFSRRGKKGKNTGNNGSRSRPILDQKRELEGLWRSQKLQPGRRDERALGRNRCWIWMTLAESFGSIEKYLASTGIPSSFFL